MKSIRFRFCWKSALIALVVAAAAGWALYHWAGLPFWMGFFIFLAGMLVNGWIAGAEDTMPGGFDHPLPEDHARTTPSVYYQALCKSDTEAIQAFYDAPKIQALVDEGTSLAFKRSGSALLFRFDDPPDTVASLVAHLRNSGLFVEVTEISEDQFGKGLNSKA